MARPKKYAVRLTDEEVERLQKTAKRKNTSPTIRDRCYVLLDMDESHPPPVKQMDCGNYYYETTYYREQKSAKSPPKIRQRVYELG